MWTEMMRNMRLTMRIKDSELPSSHYNPKNNKKGIYSLIFAKISESLNKKYSCKKKRLFVVKFSESKARKPLLQP